MYRALATTVPLLHFATEIKK